MRTQGSRGGPRTPGPIPTEDEVLSYFDALSNWGRWGADDELGTPNLITPEKTKRALATVREGVSVSLSRDILWEGAADVPSPPVHFMLESGEGWASGDKVSSRANAAAIDYIGMVFHGVAVTHVDSLAHFFWRGKPTTASRRTWCRQAWAPRCAPWWPPATASSPAACWWTCR
jgi:hypothetical protein